MPEGCGTWPAFWMVGPNWPNGGEIDIIEGVNTNNFDQVRVAFRASRVVRVVLTLLHRWRGTCEQTTLHTSQGCDMSGEDRSSFTGNMVSTNCWVNAPGQGTNQVYTHNNTLHPINKLI